MKKFDIKYNKNKAYLDYDIKFAYNNKSLTFCVFYKLTNNNIFLICSKSYIIKAE